MAAASTMITLGVIAASTGANIYAAKKASDTAHEAAQIQTTAADKAAELQRQAAKEALDFQKQMYADLQTNQRPWLQAGQGAVNRLAYLMGIEVPQGAVASTATTGVPATPSPTTAPRPARSGDIMGPAVPRRPFTATQMATNALEPRTFSPTNAPAIGDETAPAPTGQPTSLYQTVQMQAPADKGGAVQAVPVQLVDHYRKLGARVLVPQGLF